MFIYVIYIFAKAQCSKYLNNKKYLACKFLRTADKKCIDELSSSQY